MEFQTARLLSFKKALYLELMLQLSLYLFMIIADIDWSGLLIVLASLLASGVINLPSTDNNH